MRKGVVERKGGTNLKINPNKKIINNRYLIEKLTIP